MSRHEPLLESVAGLLARTYRMRTPLAEVGPFVIGDRGYRELYDERPRRIVAGTAEGSGAKTLVRETREGIRACVYFPDAMIRQLEEYPPQHGLGDENIGAFSAFVEEIDHLLVIAECAAITKSVSLFELELHANVSKHLVLARFLAGRTPRLEEAQRIWLRRHLFDAGRFVDEDPGVCRRYRDAARWAVRLLERIPKLPLPDRIATLRHFHAADGPGKLDLIGQLAA